MGYRSKAIGVVGAGIVSLASPAEAKPLDYLVDVANRTKANPTYTTAHTAVRHIWLAKGRQAMVTWYDLNKDGKVNEGDRLSIVEVFKRTQVSLFDDYGLNGVGYRGDKHEGVPASLKEDFPTMTDAQRARSHQKAVAKNVAQKMSWRDRKKRRSGRR